MRKNHILFLIIATCLAAATAYGKKIPPGHPAYVDLGNRKPVCSDCHGDESDPIVFSRYNHTSFFLEEHKTLARSRPEVCELCHRQDSCQDCHAGKTELKPSTRRPLATYKRTPHRGDYISRHRLEARIDPASCFRCHGNPRRSLSCKRCHG